MNQFKMASTIKPVRSGKNLAITSNRQESTRNKSKRGKGRAASQKYLEKTYGITAEPVKAIKAEKAKKKFKAAEDVEKAKNIFITANDEGEGESPDAEPKSPVETHGSPKAENHSPKSTEKPLNPAKDNQASPNQTSK